MSSWKLSERFLVELPDWIVRVILSAIPSAVLAVFAGCIRSYELWAMVTGTLLWVPMVTLFVSTSFMSQRQGVPWREALQRAVWIKLIWITCGALVAFYAIDHNGIWQILLFPLIPPVFYEVLSGGLLLELVGGVGHMLGHTTKPPLESYLRTTLVTILQGGMVFLELLLIACLVRGWRWVQWRLKPKRMAGDYGT